MPTVSFTINGQQVSCEKDAMLLQVARENGFDIPGLATTRPRSRTPPAGSAWCR